MSTPGKRTVGKGKEYYDYLKSDAWRDVKRRYLASKLPKDCFRCRKPWDRSFVFHHRTYKNLGCERLMDIVPMCRPCHDIVHVDGVPSNIWALTSRSRRKFAGAERQKIALVAKNDRDKTIVAKPVPSLQCPYCDRVFLDTLSRFMHASRKHQGVPLKAIMPDAARFGQRPWASN